MTLSAQLPNQQALTEILNQLPELSSLAKRGVMVEPTTGRSYFTGYDYKTLYDWDQYFEAIVQIYLGWSSELIRNAITIFLDHQQENGMISRSVPSNELHDPEHVKPFLAQTACLVVKYYGEIDWLREKDYFDRMRQYLDYWLVEMDSDHNGLSEWMSAPHTGMDNQHERAGWWLDRISEGVDLNCYIVRETKAFANLADALGEGELAVAYRQASERVAKNIRDVLWDKNDRFYYDRNWRTGELLKVRYINAFATLWAGVATQEQADAMIHEYLFNPEEFWAPYPFSALSKREPGYSPTPLEKDLGCCWRANTWIPSNYIVFHGLRQYGYDQLAKLVVHATDKLMKKAGNCEYYTSETGQGCGLDPFWGWSLLGHFLPYEFSNNVNPTLLESLK